MSASELNRLVAKALSDERETVARNVHMIRYEFPQVHSEGVVAPPTAEQIAMRVVEANACVRTYDRAIAVLNDEFRKLTAPDKGTDARKPKPKREVPYA